MCMKSIHKSRRKLKIFLLLREKDNLLFYLLFAFIISNSLSIKFHFLMNILVFFDYCALETKYFASILEKQ